MGLIDSIISAESGGDANAKNPNSSASGLGQFIDSTWLSTLKSARPDLASGKSDAELLALKTDPDLSRQMTEAYAQQNGQALTKAGLDATPGNTYLAHFAGPQGAVSVLKADPNTPVSQVLTPQAVAANPFLKGMTAGQLASWASRKVGDSAPQPVAQIAPMTPASPAIAPPTAAPIFAPAAPQQTAQPMPDPGGSGASFFGQMPAEQVAQPPPIFTPQRKPVSLAALKQALSASQSRGFFLPRG